MAHLDLHARAHWHRVHEPVHLTGDHAVTEQRFPRPDDDGSIRGANGDDVHRGREAPGHSPTLPDGVARVAIVLSDHGPVTKHDRTAAERGRVASESSRNDLGVVTVRNEADVLALD